MNYLAPGLQSTPHQTFEQEVLNCSDSLYTVLQQGRFNFYVDDNSNDDGDDCADDHNSQCYQ